MSTAQFALSYADPATCKLESKTMESLKTLSVLQFLQNVLCLMGYR